MPLDDYKIIRINHGQNAFTQFSGGATRITDSYTKKGYEARIYEGITGAIQARFHWSGESDGNKYIVDLYTPFIHNPDVVALTTLERMIESTSIEYKINFQKIS